MSTTTRPEAHPETHPETMGRRKRGRDVDGVVLLDKPVGCSSNAALQRTRRAFDARKAGHTGSLDPLASGLLPVCFGEATKVSGYLLHADKRYRVTAVVGAETSTGDREGEITRQSDAKVPDAAAFKALLARFLGPQQQTPPMYSALKKDGKRLYEYARAGQEVERAPRDIVVHAIDCLETEAEAFTLDVRVSGGTYIRTLVEDIARAWDGRAHVGALRRIGVGDLGTTLPMVELDILEARAEAGEPLADWLYPVSTVLSGWPRVCLDEVQARAIGHGRTIAAPASHAAPVDAVCLTGENGELYGFGCIDAEGMLSPRRLFARPQR